MRILKFLFLIFACLVAGQALGQQPWTSSNGSGEMMLAWNGGGHGARFHRPYYGHKYYAPRHRGFKHHHHPGVIISPHVGFVIGPQPYYYDRYYYPHRPRVVIQYYDPRFGVFFGTEFRNY